MLGLCHHPCAAHGDDAGRWASPPHGRMPICATPGSGRGARACSRGPEPITLAAGGWQQGLVPASPPQHGVKLVASQDLGFNNWQPPGEPPALGDCRASRKGHLAQLFIVQQRHVQPFPKIPRAQLWELHLIREIQINSFPIFFFPFFFSPQTMKETDGS